MQQSSETNDNSAFEARDSFWKRRFLTPIGSQLQQDTSPRKISQSMACGAAIGILPVLGTTTALCGIAAVALRLNHIAIQAINWLVYPLQIVLFIPFLHAGNILFGLPPVSLSLTEITAAFEANFFAAFIELGWLALRGVAAWAAIMIPFIFLASRLMRPLVRRLAMSISKDASLS